MVMDESPEVLRSTLLTLRQSLANISIPEEILNTVPVQQDNFLLRFLRCTDFDTEKAFNLVRAYLRFYDNLCQFEAKENPIFGNTFSTLRKSKKNKMNLKEYSSSLLSRSLPNLKISRSIKSMKFKNLAKQIHLKHKHNSSESTIKAKAAGKKKKIETSSEVSEDIDDSQETEDIELESSDVRLTTPFDSSKVVECLSAGWIQLPNPPVFDRHFRQLVMVFPRKFQPNRFTSVDICSTVLRIVDSALKNVATQRNGIFLIIDFTDAKPENIHAGNFVKIVKILQHCLPIKVGFLQIIGLPSFTKSLWKVLQPILSKKVKKSMNVCKNTNKENVGYVLEEYFDMKNLPEVYNGELKTWNCENSMKNWAVNYCL